MKILIWVIAAPLALATLALGAGQMGLLAGNTPGQLGVTNGRLQPPSRNPNSVSSQATLYPDHPQRDYAAMPPLVYQGDGAAAMARLLAVLQSTKGARIVTHQPDYLYVQCETPLLRFTDDVEFWLDPQSSAIQFRSASRLGRKDFGVNRARIESIRARLKG